MKKVLFFVAVATFILVSCERHELETPKSFIFKASIEDFATKANIGENNVLLWAAGDKIGIYVNDDSWTDKNQPFTLVGNGGSTSGEFVWDYTGNFSTKAAAAFFPWQAKEDGEVNSVSTDGLAHFKLFDSYYKYTSGKMLTPLIASLSGSTDDIKFKHAGAAIKVTINNLPAGAHSIGMTVKDQQISGSYQINPAYAGTVAMTLDGAADPTKNTLWLNYTNDSECKFTFIFPVPALTQPKLSFEIWDKNGVLVWSKSPKTQSSLDHADILVMPELDITPYSQFKSYNQTWFFCYGTPGGSDWTLDIPMMTDETGTICILSGRTFSAGKGFKIRKDRNWNESYPASDWVFDSGNAGQKDIIFNTLTHEIKVVDAGCPYPTAPPVNQ